MRRVIIESPFAGDRQRNKAYAKAALHDCLLRGEAPMASHLLYPEVLDDGVPEERELGILAGLEWGLVAHATVVYHDFGISSGMEQGILAAQNAGRSVEYRILPEFKMLIPGGQEK